jgi:hypothetical protein
MPWTKAAHAFFELCGGKDRAKAVKKCPKKTDAKRMASEGVKGTTTRKR